MPNPKFAHLRAKARELRQQGYTLPEIIEFLKMPRSTVFGWIRDIEVAIQRMSLTSNQTPKQVQARLKAAEANKRNAAAKRDVFYQRGLAEAPELFQNPLFRDFIVLYMAEGFKRDKNVVEIANSDTAALILSQYWILQFRNPNGKIHYRIQIHVDQDEARIKQHWSEQLDVPVEQIVVMRKSNSNQLTGRKFRSQYGVMSIRVSDTYFRARLEAWLDYLKKQWMDLKSE
jgi:hypothetical protein